jgi:hypothetical protein
LRQGRESEAKRDFDECLARDNTLKASLEQEIRKVRRRPAGK